MQDPAKTLADVDGKTGHSPNCPNPKYVALWLPMSVELLGKPIELEILLKLLGQFL